VSRALCLAWRVLDIGCGTGQTTRQAAHAAAPAEVLGVDVSAAALNLGRRRAREQGLSNISFEHGDAQVHPFPAGHFDVAVSRFGTMFFHDPLAAFTNAARALRPGARLVLLVWQSHDGDEWSTAVRDALAPNTPRPTPPPADAERARQRLHDLLTAHHTSDGVQFDSAAWIITAERAG
jgi:ubiquinone/menaquinone biosynthesis C-methylase UbiE